MFGCFERYKDETTEILLQGLTILLLSFDNNPDNKIGPMVLSDLQTKFMARLG